MFIATGYRIAIVSPTGEVLDTVPLAQYDLDKPLARTALLEDIVEQITTDRAARKER